MNIKLIFADSVWDLIQIWTFTLIRFEIQPVFYVFQWLFSLVTNSLRSTSRPLWVRTTLISWAVLPTRTHTSGRSMTRSLLPLCSKVRLRRYRPWPGVRTTWRGSWPWTMLDRFGSGGSMSIPARNWTMMCLCMLLVGLKGRVCVSCFDRFVVLWLVGLNEVGILNSYLVAAWFSCTIWPFWTTTHILLHLPYTLYDFESTTE